MPLIFLHIMHPVVTVSRQYNLFAVAHDIAFLWIRPRPIDRYSDLPDLRSLLYALPGGPGTVGLALRLTKPVRKIGGFRTPNESPVQRIPSLDKREDVVACEVACKEIAPVAAT